jgi:hypothetical protein
MIASREEASDLLQKWFNEHTPVTALFTIRTGTFAVKVSGFINGVTSSILISDGTHDPGIRSQNYILLSTLGAHHYEYLEAKDLGLSQEELAFVTDVHSAASLSILFSDGARLSLFEKR